MWRFDPSIDPVEAIKDELRMIALNENDPYLDGFVTSKYKKDLLDIYWYLQDLLDKCSDYGDTEKEWHEQRDKDRMINKLSGKNEYKKD